LGRPVGLLLNIAHTLDHLVLLVFASAVAAIASDFGLTRWEDLMPYTAGAFLMFGLGSIPSGRLGDLWGRRKAMLLFFFGTAASCLLVASTQSPLQMAAALTLLGAFASIYHPVGIPMLVRDAARPGAVIGWNNMAGNLGIALAALLAGYAVSYGSWRLAFLLPGLVALILGLAFLRLAPRETLSPAKADHPRRQATPKANTQSTARALIVVTAAASTGSILYNFTTNGNTELFRERLNHLLADPTDLGLVLAALYVVASCAQVIVGQLSDKMALRPLFLTIVCTQTLFFMLAAYASGWWFYVFALGFMAAIFGAIPFTDTVMVRYVDDRQRSRMTGLRIGIAFIVSSVVIAGLGPAVKAAGFGIALLSMAAVSILTLVAIWQLPADPANDRPSPA
jgi:MFS family permease